MSLCVYDANLSGWPMLAKLEPSVRSRLRKFICTGDQLFGLTIDRKVLAFGDNQKGYLGLGHKNKVFSPKENVELSNQRVSDIYCCNDRFVALTEAGCLWAWGSDEEKQLGTDGNEHTSLIPNFVMKGVATIAFGRTHSLVMDITGRVLGWGGNRHGQVGNITEEHCKPTKRVKLASMLKGQASPARVTSFRENSITEIACGDEHSLALNYEGKVFGWGKNEEGQLGPGHDDVLIPRRLPLPASFRCWYIAAGGNVSLMLSGLNEMYICGNNQSKLISYQDGIMFKEIFILPIDRSPQKIDHLFIGMTKANEVYTWKDLQDDQDELEPDHVGYSLPDVLASNGLAASSPTMLEWRNTSPGVIPERFASFFDNPDYSDVTFTFSCGRTIHGHRFVLSTVSDYFKTQLSTVWTGPNIRITYPYELSYNYLKFLYTGQLDVTYLERGIELLNLALGCRSTDLTVLICELLVFHFLKTTTSTKLLNVAKLHILDRMTTYVTLFRNKPWSLPEEVRNPALIELPKNTSLTHSISPVNMDSWPLLDKLDKTTLDKLIFWQTKGGLGGDVDRARWSRIFAITNDDQVFAFGNNHYGCLGLGHSKTVTTAQEIKELNNKKVVDIICADRRVMARTVGGALWCWGEHRSGASTNSRKQNDFHSPRLIFHKDVDSVKCCTRHIAVLNRKGKLLVWGASDDDPVDFDDGNISKTLPLENGTKFKQIDCGDLFTLALTTKGKIFAFACFDGPKLKDGGSPAMYRSEWLDIKKPCKYIACASQSFAALTVDGDIFVNRNKTSFDVTCRWSNCTPLDTIIACPRAVSNDYYFGITIDQQLCGWEYGKEQETLDNCGDSLPDALIAVCTNEDFLQCPVMLNWSSSSVAHLGMCVPRDEVSVRSDFKFNLPGNVKIPAHRILLMSASNYMRSKLASAWRDFKHRTATEEVRNFSSPVFELYVKYLYTDRIHPADKDQARELLQLAIAYKEYKLQNKCINSIALYFLTRATCIEFYEFACKHHLDTFADRIGAFMAAHYAELSSSKQFDKLSRACSDKFKNDFKTKYSKVNELEVHAEEDMDCSSGNEDDDDISVMEI